MKQKGLRSIQNVMLGAALLTGASTTAMATEIIREAWDGYSAIGNVYPANQTVTNGSSSLGFNATSPWITNPDQHANNTLLSIRSFFPESWNYGLPPNYNGINCGFCQDNGFPGSGGGASLWSDGIWMVRQLTPQASINFNAEGEYYLAVHVGMNEGFAQYVGAEAAFSPGGIGFADGATTNANFVSIGVTGTNVFIGPPDINNPIGTVEATKTVYVSHGTLGQAGNTNSLLYHGPSGTLTNFTGGPYYIRAYGTNRVGQCVGDGILVLGHLITHVGGNATIQVKFYNFGSSDTMDITTNITWDCSSSFNYTGTMNRMLVFEYGQFPFFIYDFRVGTTLRDAVGMDSEITVYPQPNVYVGSALNMTNFAAVANPGSNPVLAGAPNYGTISYQWRQNGANIAGATNNFLNIASASTSDPSMPAGTDAGTFTCVSVDASGTWGSVTSAPVVVTVTLDNVPPTVTQISPSPDLSTIKIYFSETVNGAGNVGSYSIPGLTVTNASAIVANNQTVVVLKTTAQPLASKFTITMSGITDPAANPVTPNTVSFWSHMNSSGRVTYEAWNDDANGYGANAYFAQYPLPTTPTPVPDYSANFASWEASLLQVTPLSGGAASSDTYGTKMYGWFIPPVTTNYVFFVSADDACRLSLSTNDSPANLRVIAVESLWSPSDNWTNYSTAFPTGDHRGSGAANNNPGGFGGPNGGWDSGPDQNRSDEFIAAYTADQGGLWTATQLSFITDITGNPSAAPFWSVLDSNGNALITLQAGQRYFLQAEHLQQFGGGNLSVTYKFATNPGSRSNDPATGSTSILSGSQIAALVPFQPSIAISNSISGPVITFAGILQSSTSVGGPYTNVPGATSPYLATGGTHFFRASQ